MATIYTRAIKGSALTWTEGDANITNLNNDKMEKSAPALAGNLDVGSYSITTTTTNGTITIEPNGTGDLHVITDALRIGDLNAEARISTYGTGNLVLTTNEGNDPDPTITIGNGANANITIAPTGTGYIILDGLNWPIADGTNGQVLQTNGSATLSFVTPSVSISTGVSGLGTSVATALAVAVGSSGALITNGGALGTPSSGTVTNLTGTASININGTVGATTANTGAFTTLTFKNPIEAIYNIGTTGGTVAPDPANGSVQQITLNSALTINAFTNPTAGESLTLIIYGGTAYTSITSTMKFAGGIKTLTGTAGCIDILSIYYDGTTYFASLGKGYA